MNQHNGSEGDACSHECQYKTHLGLEVSEILQEMLLGQLAEPPGLRDHLVGESDLVRSARGI